MDQPMWVRILMNIWPKKGQAAMRKHWLGEGVRYFKDGKPEKAIATLYNVISSQGPEDQAGQAAYCTAVYYQGWPIQLSGTWILHGSAIILSKT